MCVFCGVYEFFRNNYMSDVSSEERIAMRVEWL